MPILAHTRWVGSWLQRRSPRVSPWNTDSLVQVQRWKLLSSYQVKGWVNKMMWLLIGCTRVNNRSEPGQEVDPILTMTLNNKFPPNQHKMKFSDGSWVSRTLFSMFEKLRNLKNSNVNYIVFEVSQLLLHYLGMNEKMDN